MRRAANADAEVQQIMSAADGATGGGVAARRRPVVRYGRDVLSPGKHCPTVSCCCKSVSVY